MDIFCLSYYSFAFWLLGHLVVGLTMRWETLTFYAGFHPCGWFFYLTIASFSFYQKLTIMRSIFNPPLKARIVDSFPLECHLEGLQPQGSSGIWVSIFQCSWLYGCFHLLFNLLWWPLYLICWLWQHSVCNAWPIYDLPLDPWYLDPIK